MRDESRVISVSHGAAYFMPQGQRGGWGIILSDNGTLPYFFIPLILRGLSPYSSPHAGRSAKIRGDDSDPPPKRRFPAAPRSGPVGHALSPSPGGRYRPHLSLREG